MKSLTISKLDAVKRQIETVIRMYFNNGDPVSMHTLAAAAYGVIRDINKRRGGAPMLQDSLLERVLPEHVDLVRRKLSAAQNFFKHADRDHDETLEFNPDSTEFLVLDCCHKYWELSGELPPLFQIYRGWMMMVYKDIFILSEVQKRQVAEASVALTPAGRAAFFSEMLVSVMKNGI